MKKAVLYINQFFGGVGGEDEADFRPVVKDAPVGPALALNAALKDVEITHTVICGDNFMNSNQEEALSIIDGFLSGLEFDLFFAGPAFQSGRYGMSCGEICRFVHKKYGVPCITSMNEENPGVDAYKTAPIYIMRGNKSSVRLRKDAGLMAKLANKFAAGEEILWASEEGYFPHGIRVDVACDETAADRAVDMLLKKLAGEPFETEFPIEKPDSAEPAKAVDVANSNVAIITTGSLVPMGNPDHLPSGTASVWMEYDISELDSFKSGDWYSVHGGFSTNNVNADPEVLVPLSAIKELVAEGAIAELYPNMIVTTGNLTIVKEARRMGSEIAEMLREKQIRSAILVST